MLVARNGARDSSATPVAASADPEGKGGVAGTQGERADGWGRGFEQRIVPGAHEIAPSPSSPVAIVTVVLPSLPHAFSTVSRATRVSSPIAS